MNFLDPRILYPLQEDAILQLQGINDPQFESAKLCGGTALARCYLNHRISYDLDFFLPGGFNPTKFLQSINSNGIKYEVKEINESSTSNVGNQIHGLIIINGKELKVSFIEDSYYDLFSVENHNLKRFLNNDTFLIKTESINGLYHRKLRTVSGNVSDGDDPKGGRQTARDLFDLYVLSKKYMPIKEFIGTLPYSFPVDAFNAGIAKMPWWDLVEEVKGIVSNDKWSEAKDIKNLENHLCSEIGAKIIYDDQFELNDQDEPSNDKKVEKKSFWKRFGFK